MEFLQSLQPFVCFPAALQDVVLHIENLVAGNVLVAVQLLRVLKRLDLPLLGRDVEVGFDARACDRDRDTYGKRHPTGVLRLSLVPLVLAAIPILDSLFVAENPIAVLLNDLVERDLDVRTNAGLRWIRQAAFRILALKSEREPVRQCQDSIKIACPAATRSSFRQRA